MGFKVLLCLLLLFYIYSVGNDFKSLFKNRFAYDWDIVHTNAKRLGMKAFSTIILLSLVAINLSFICIYVIMYINGPMYLKLLSILNTSLAILNVFMMYAQFKEAGKTGTANNLFVFRVINLLVDTVYVIAILPTVMILFLS